MALKVIEKDIVETEDIPIVVATSIDMPLPCFQYQRIPHL